MLIDYPMPIIKSDSYGFLKRREDYLLMQHLLKYLEELIEVVVIPCARIGSGREHRFFKTFQ